MVAASGKDDGKGTYHVKNVRDFAFCASDFYHTKKEQYDRVELTVYYIGARDSTANRILYVAKRSLKLYSDTFGKYPYDTLNFVMNGLTGGVNGMEYPTLVMLDPDDIVRDSESPNVSETQSYLRNIDNPTCHEIAHQWFYGIVGNDQIASPWLGEGFCRFCEYLYEKEYVTEVTD